MAQIEILIVEDQANWQSLLLRTLETLGANVRLSVASDYNSARSLVRDKSFDLAVVDLSLPGLTTAPEGTDELGFRILEDLRSSEFSQACGILILTAYPTRERTRRAFKELGVYDFLGKDDFERDGFLQTVRGALFNTVLKRIKTRRERRQLMSFTFRQNHINSIQLRGPDRYQDYQLAVSHPISAEDLTRRCDQINVFLSPPYRVDLRERWRLEAHSIGRDLYSMLGRIPEVVGALAVARSLAPNSNELSLHFNGPTAYLSIPFELLNDGQDYLALMHPLHRQAFSQDIVWSRKVEPLHIFLERLQREKRKLRILLIASNVGVRAEAVDDEIAALEQLLHSRLGLLDLDYVIEVCPSKDATYAHVESLLARKNSHIIHYAGHGRFDDEIAEGSGLYFLDDNRLRIMQTDVLKLLLQNSSTQFVYLSCCLGARTASQVGRGDFLGIMDSMVQADVPAAIGYRWVVTDRDARDFALEFYDSLFTSFSLEDAAFTARNAIVREEGRQDETWASPILVLQNP